VTPAAGLESLGTWGFPAAAGWTAGRGGAHAVTGAADVVFPWASVTKVLAAAAMWVAVEEGTVSWEDEAGPPGSTLRHLLSHCSGLAPDDDRVLAAPARRRIYSNRGIEVAADHLAAAANIPFWEYVREAVTEPLGMATCQLEGSPASGASGSISDLLALAAELREPTLVSSGTLRVARTVAFPGLGGVLPGFGRYDNNDWGLGVEIRDSKSPHWTGGRNSPRTFGHFGRSGSFVWVDPVAGVAAASLASRPFGEWAVEAWPVLSDDILAAADRSAAGRGG
jgi:CubicO group peptidase (beta-lactamase class C family)